MTTTKSIESKTIEYLSESFDYSAYEAVPKPGNVIKVPNFHYIVYKREDNVWVGYCLDFDIHAYSKETDPERASQKLFNRLVTMVLMHITTLVETDQLDDLFQDCNWGFNYQSWGSLFSKKFNEDKVRILKESINIYMVQMSTGDEAISDDDGLKAAYDKLRTNQQEFEALQKKISTYLNDKGSNVAAFIPKRLDIIKKVG